MAKGKSGTGKKDTVVKKTGAGAAMSSHSRDAGKQASTKKKAPAKKAAAAKTPVAAHRSAAKSSKGGTSIASKVLRKVKATASGAVNLAGSIIGRQGSQKS